MEISHQTPQELPLIMFTEKKQERLKSNTYAPIEPRTQKILNKLKKRLDQLDEQITKEGLEKSREKIQNWIHRHTTERVNLKTSSFSIFSEGRNAAKMSRRVENFRKHLKNDFNKTQASFENLKGRVSITS